MGSCPQPAAPVMDELDRDANCVALYPMLLPLAKSWVFAAHIYSWTGQENNIAWDIVLVTIQRTYEYALKAQYENIPIVSLQGLSIKIAKKTTSRFLNEKIVDFNLSDAMTIHRRNSLPIT